MKYDTKYLSVKQLSQMTDIKTQSIYYFIRNCGLKHHRIKKKILINPADFQQFMEAHKVEEINSEDYFEN